MTTTAASPPAPVVVVTGANGLVGARVCAALLERGAAVRAVVRRAGTAPASAGLTEHVGDFTEPDFAATLVDGADAVVATVHPMGSDRATQQQVGVEGTTRLARATRDAGVATFVHVSTCAVYDRRPEAGDVTETSTLVGDDAGDYPVTKRDLDAALAGVEGITRVLVRPPAILGPGETSVWNTLQPAAAREDEQQLHRNPAATFAWVHVDDLAALLADVAVGRVGTTDDVATGPVARGCTAVNVAGDPATLRDYVGTVAQALGLTPAWDEGLPAWTGLIRTDRARGWGWTPAVTLSAALAELADGLAGSSAREAR